MGIMHRLSRDQVERFPLAEKDMMTVIKYLCKDFWRECFGKQADRLQTNYKGTFVLRDEDFVWIRHVVDTENARATVQLAGGVLVGALEALGYKSTLEDTELIAG